MLCCHCTSAKLLDIIAAGHNLALLLRPQVVELQIKTGLSKKSWAYRLEKMPGIADWPIATHLTASLEARFLCCQ